MTTKALPAMTPSERAVAVVIVKRLAEKYHWIGYASEANTFTRAEIRQEFEDMLKELTITAEEQKSREQAKSLALSFHEVVSPGVSWESVPDWKREAILEQSLKTVRLLKEKP